MAAKTFDLDQIKGLFKSSTFVPFLMIWITHGIGGWGISFVLPTVIYELGISNTAISQVMTMVRRSCAYEHSSVLIAVSLPSRSFS
jgi:hypothetical protein